MWVECSPEQTQILLHFGSVVRTLSRVSSVQVHSPLGGNVPLSGSSSPPKGCLVGVVDHTCRLHLDVKVKQHSSAQSLNPREQNRLYINIFHSKSITVSFPTAHMYYYILHTPNDVL